MVTTSRMFCPRCGKPTEAEGLCAACFAEKYVVFTVPQVVEVKLCAKCPSYKIGEVWVVTGIESYEELAEKATLKTVKLALEVSKEVRQPKIKITAAFTSPQILKVHVAVSGEIDGRPVATEIDTEARIRKETCDVCSRIAGGYYEGIVQIRAENRFPTRQEVERCLKIVENTFVRAAKSGDRLAFITDIFPMPEGADLYVGSNSCARQAVRSITDEFGGTLQESPKLVGAVGGKGVYRVTFAVRLPDIVAGDIVRMRGNTVLVEKVGKRIGGTDLSTGQSTSGPEDLKLEKVANRSQAQQTVLVSEDGGSVQILDPESYGAVTLRKPAFLTKKPGEEVWVVRTPDGLFLLPGSKRGKE